MSAPDAVCPSPRSATPGFCVLLGLILLVVGGKAVLYDTMDPDCFWHLKVGEQLTSEGIGPLVDRLSFSSIPQAWTPYSWLAELGMKAVWDHGGYRLALVVQVLLEAGFVLTIALACRATRPAAPAPSRFFPDLENQNGPRSQLAALVATAFGTFISLSYLSFRPVTAALGLLGLCAWLLVRDRAGGERSRAIWLVPPLTLVMVNLHLYAIFVPVWIGALWAGALWERWWLAQPAERDEADRRTARYLLLLGTSALACCATPMLSGAIETAVHYQYEDPMVASGYLSEMWPFFHGTMGAVAGMLVMMALICIAIRWRALRPGEFLWLAGSVLILSRMGRFAPVFALAASPMLATALNRLSDRPLQRRALWGATLIVLSLGTWRVARSFPAAHEPLAAWLNRPDAGSLDYPCDAAKFVEEHVQPQTGRLISEFSWGGYLEWRLGSQYQLLLDGRTQLFSPEFWRATYLGGPEERLRFLSKVQADAAILPESGSIFRHALVQLGWRSVYRKPGVAEVMLPPLSSAADTGRRSWEIVSSLLP